MVEKAKLTYNADEVGQVLGISRPNVYQLFHRADFPVVKLSPRRYVVPVKSLERWLDAQAEKGGEVALD